MESFGLILQLAIGAIMGTIASVIAVKKNRSGVGWFFGGFFLGIIGIVIVALLKDPDEESKYKAYVENENRRLKEQLYQEKLKNETFRQHAMERLDKHDEQLGIDTKQTQLPGNTVTGYIED